MDLNLKIKKKLINHLTIGIVVSNDQGQIIFTNKNFKEMTGYTETEINTIDSWYKKAYPNQESRKKAKELFNYDKKNDISDRTYRITTAAGDNKYLNFCYSKLEDGKNLFEIIDISHKITEKNNFINQNKILEKEKELKETKERLELAVDGANIGVWDWNFKTNYIHYNQNWAQMLGYKTSDLKYNKNTWLDLVHPADKKRALKDINDHLENKTKKYFNEHRLKTKSGNWKWVRDIGKVTEKDIKGNPVRMVGVHIDIDQEKRTAAEIKSLSYHDALTGLYNRRYLNEEIKRLSDSRRYPISIIVGDLNNLKDINDNYGHLMGDKYIKLTAGVIKKSLRSEDLVARVGGDEFAIILPEADKDEVENLVDRILKNIEQKNKDNKLPKPLSIAIGYEIADSYNTINYNSLIKCYHQADLKMYKNKFAADYKISEKN